MPGMQPGHSANGTRANRADGFSTRAIRIGQDPCEATGATIVPIFQTATFTKQAVGKDRGFDYSRSGNPTRSALEEQLASLEGGAYCAAFASGMAAIFGACSFLRTGDHIVATEDLYGGTHRLLVDVLGGYGIETSFVETADAGAVAAALRPNTKLIWLETPTNPLLRLTDIAAIASLKRPGLVVAVDNTFLSPYFQRPLELGADLVVHSTTKYVNGHSDVVGGAVVANDPDLFAKIAFHQNSVGAVPGPVDGYLTLRGIKTLALRMKQHEANALDVARFLEAREDVAKVYYPGLQAHPDHELAKRQQHGFGGVVSFRLRGGEERAHAFVERTRLFNLAVSLGGVESLLCLPWSMTHASIPPERKLELGITTDLIRLSVGIEEIADLLGDLEGALEATNQAVLALR
jgi:cystathionine gamma-lyase